MKSDDRVSNPVEIRAVAVGKIKEKLENTGLAMLSLALMYNNPMDSWGELIITLTMYVQSDHYQFKQKCIEKFLTLFRTEAIKSNRIQTCQYYVSTTVYIKYQSLSVSYIMWPGLGKVLQWFQHSGPLAIQFPI